MSRASWDARGTPNVARGGMGGRGWVLVEGGPDVDVDVEAGGGRPLVGRAVRGEGTYCG